jgi:hypothetical protein
MSSNAPFSIPVVQYGGMFKFDGVSANTGLNGVGAMVDEGDGLLEDVFLAWI